MPSPPPCSAPARSSVAAQTTQASSTTTSRELTDCHERRSHAVFASNGAASSKRSTLPKLTVEAARDQKSAETDL